MFHLLLTLFGLLYCITRNFLHGCHKRTVGTHQESCCRDKSLSAQPKSGGKIVPATCATRFNFRRSRSMSRRQNSPRTPYTFVFSPLYNMSLQWNQSSWANQRQWPEFFVIMQWEGRQTKPFPATCSYLCRPRSVIFSLACYICLHIPVTRQFGLLHVILCLLHMLHIPVCTADFVIGACLCSNSLQPLSSGLPTFDLKFTPVINTEKSTGQALVDVKYLIYHSNLSNIEIIYIFFYLKCYNC